MSFISLDFIAFFAVFFLVWTRLAEPGAKKSALLAASWLFYAWAYPPYLALLLASTAFSYFLGLRMRKPGASPKVLLALGLSLHLGLLGFFKYSEFLLSLWRSTFGLPPSGWLGVALPIGISFFTFHNISYLMDLARGQLEPIESFKDYALYIAFFPQLVAGPLLRVRELLPQLEGDALRGRGPLPGRALAFLSLGFFKKVVLADSLAPLVDAAFARPGSLNAVTALIALYAYAFQIYFDFSGYTDIAEGLANLLGIQLVENFRAPYLASSLREFWQRWHMSLSRWLRDYLYIPLGGSKGTWFRTFVALLLTMALGGLWHGAAMHFVVWGIFHGLLLALEHRWQLWRGSKFLTFHLVLFGWLLFRLPNLGSFHAWALAFSSLPQEMLPRYALNGLALLAFCLWLHNWEDRHASALRSPEGLRLPGPALAGMHAAIVFFALAYANQSNPFIYFQF